MKVDKKILPQSQVELTVEISPKEIAPYLESAASKVSKEAKIDGFRPGHVPYQVLKEKIGEEKILAEAAEEIVNKTYFQAVQQQDLKVVGDPKVKIEKVSMEAGIIYKATAALLPKVKLTSPKKIKIKKNKIEIAQEKVDRTINELRKMRAKEALVAREAKKGDKIEVDFDVFQNNVMIDGGSAKKQAVILGEGNFIPGFEDNLLGLKANEEKKFELEFPKDYFQKNLAGRKAEFRVKAHSVFEINLPEKNDQFAQAVGKFKTFKELEEKIKENLQLEEENKEKHKLRNQILDEMIKKSGFDEIPALLLESEKDKMLEEMKTELSKNNLQWQHYLEHLKKTEEELKKDFSPQAERRVKSALIVREIALDQKIEISKEEVDQEIAHLVSAYADQESLLKVFKSQDYRNYIERMLINEKAMEFLEKNVNMA